MNEKDDVELLSTPKSDSELIIASPSKMSARELKERAIAKALSEAARPREEKVIERPMRTHFRWSRIIFAFACAAMAVFAIVYFVNLNSPDISLKVAAMQTGIEVQTANVDYTPSYDSGEATAEAIKEASDKF